MSEPDRASIPFDFLYKPSHNGPSTNLLILLHGLGDTHIPFHKLGRQLNLPQTATLALCAPLPIPFIDNGFQWYPSFDPIGDLLPNPNPTAALDGLSRTIDHLIDHAHWSPNRIHLFGFAQGGSLASELALRFHTSSGTGDHLGSVVTISGPLLSYPTSTTRRCPTPLLVFHRPATTTDSESALSFPPSAVSDFSRAFTTVINVARSGADGMPRSKDEWEPIMAFWSDRLAVVQKPPEGFEEISSR